MNVRSGYKQTEVGVIPSSWTLSELQGVCREPITYGIVQCGPHLENGVPYIRVSDMNSQELDVSGMLRTNPAIAARFSRSTVKEGDIVYALRGKIGEVRRVGPTVAGANLTQGTARISPNDSLRTDFLLWALRSQRSLRQAQLGAKGSTFREITLADLRRIQLPIPPAAEQEAIAGALSDADALIESLEQLITKKRQLKQGAMQELLTSKKRLQGFSGDWKVRPFDCVLSRLNVKVHQIQASDYQTTGRYPVVDQGQEAVIGFSDRHEKRFRCPKDGVIVFGDHTCVVKFVDCDFLVGADGTQVLQANNGQCTRFHAFQLQQRGIAPTGYNRHYKFLKEREFLTPSRAEQIAIATILSDMDAEITALEARLAKARQLKQGMMQELLTGRILLV